MKWSSVSLPVSEALVTYKNLQSKRAVIERTQTFQTGRMTESTLHLPLHTGTHVDYPLHMIDGGKCSSDYQRFPADIRAYVLDVSGEAVESVGLEHVQNLDLTGANGLFIKTLKAPLTTFNFEFPWLNAEAAAWLAEKPLAFVGTDQPGIERNQPGHETHISLLEKDILIIEGMDLSRVSEGVHTFTAVTLHLQGVEAEPVMVFLHEETQSSVK